VRTGSKPSAHGPAGYYYASFLLASSDQPSAITFWPKLFSWLTLSFICQNSVMIYLFYGDDRFSLQEEVKRLKTDNVPPDVEDFNFCKLDALQSGFNLDELLNTADAFPFLSDMKVVVVSSLLVKFGKSAAAEERAAARAAVKGRGAAATPTTPRARFLDFVSRLPATTILVLVEDKVTKTDQIYKAIEKQGAVREFASPKDWALEKWINERAAQDQIKLDRAVAGMLREYLGSDLFRLHNELQKLAAYAGPGQTVTPAMVELLTAELQESKIWDLTDALARCDLKTSLNLLNRLRNETTLNRTGFTRQIFNLICKQVFDLLRIRDLYINRKSVKEIAEATGMHPYRIEKTLPLTRNFQADRLDRLYTRLTELDYADKTGRADLTAQLDLLIVEICQSK
jgi:DNA polymerase III subunit delta